MRPPTAIAFLVLCWNIVHAAVVPAGGHLTYGNQYLYQNASTLSSAVPRIPGFRHEIRYNSKLPLLRFDMWSIIIHSMAVFAQKPREIALDTLSTVGLNDAILYVKPTPDGQASRLHCFHAVMGLYYLGIDFSEKERFESMFEFLSLNDQTIGSVALQPFNKGSVRRMARSKGSDPEVTPPTEPYHDLMRREQPLSNMSLSEKVGTYTDEKEVDFKIMWKMTGKRMIKFNEVFQTMIAGFAQCSVFDPNELNAYVIAHGPRGDSLLDIEDIGRKGGRPSLS